MSPGDASIARGMVLDPETSTLARRLLGPERALAFEEGAAPVLLRGQHAPVASVLLAERANAYVTVLYGLLLLRRAHELEPLHEDLYRRLAPAQAARGEPYEPEQFAQDMTQLLEWGCVARRTEPLKIRGYKDIRREKYRYRLSEDAIALLEWLEERLAALLEGRTQDSRDLLTDVLGQLKEIERIAERWRKDERAEDMPRRAVYLLTRIDDTVQAITDELLSFSAGMVAFASRPYEFDALRTILGWLERYVTVYLARIEQLRGEIQERLDRLTQPRFRQALRECQAELERERELAPLSLRAGGVMRSPDELLDAQRPFFEHRGQLAQLCARIDDSSRGVLRKMYRHLRELERRSALLQDLRARIREVAGLAADGPDPRLGAFLNALVASAHGRFARRRPPARDRVQPPMPRATQTPRREGDTSRPLRPKRASPETVRILRAKRAVELGVWLEEVVLRGELRVRLSELAPTGSEAPRCWLDVVRAQHLACGRELSPLGVGIEDTDGPPATLGTAEVGLEAPDCLVSRRKRP